MKNFLFLVLSLFIASTASAEQVTVGEFLKYCKPLTEAQISTATAPDLVANFKCRAYLDGVTDGLVVAISVGSGKKLFCLPNEGLTIDGSYKMIEAFIKSKNIKNEESLRSVVSAAYINYFPCKFQPNG